MQCTHTDQIVEGIRPKAKGCMGCTSKGDNWVMVRKCMTCGYTGCCGSSKNKHARKHFEETGHPIIHSNTFGQDWMWCYIDKVYL